MPETKLESGDAYVRHFVKILKKSIETDHSFYPPIMIAHGLHALVAQKYVESNPVSALVLVSPFIPEIIQDRFQTLSQKLALGNKIPVSSAGSEADQQETEGSLGTETDKQEQQQEFYFETHADVTAQQGFRARYILPAQAEYEIDRVAKALQDKREQTEKETSTDTEDHAHLRKELHAPETLNQENTHQDSQNKSNSDNEPAADPNEALGKDSLPVLDENESKLSSTMTTDATTGTDIQADDESMPVQTVGSEASVHSPLERLPLSIYDSIPPSLFEPTFPILLVTSDGDQVVSTKDVKEHHRLSGEVDHIELEDRGKSGGHLIMCPDNAEWEEGIQGITAWLDSNGM
ncbi:hypothetical protein BGW38_008411 [Lunasporangiospora selenospora]|uniref:Alpha/beta hydrolase family protein n=1 Tax=Lunasporangiospora selenospora TaxID=979761 RepID=A0A9P6FY09_9FUNG|nr:hypothetical protein BGW38_008411 [Lunasporangiospora selenospora]